MTASFPVSKSGSARGPNTFPNNHIRGPILSHPTSIFPMPTAFTQDIITKAFLFVHYKAFQLPCLPLSLCQMQLVLVSYGCYNKLPHIQWLNTTHIYYFTVWKSEVQNGSYGAKIKVSAEQWPFQRFQGRIHSLSLPAFTSCPHFLTCGYITLTSASAVPSFLTLTLLPLSYKGPCDYIQSTCIIQGNFLISRSLS